MTTQSSARASGHCLGDSQACVVAEAEHGRETVRLALERRPDVVVMDITMPVLNGVEATRQITAAAPGVKVLVLSMHSEKRFVAEMLRVGASGFLLKDCSFNEIAHAVNAVASNQTYVTS